MEKLQVLDRSGQKTAEVSLPASVFATKTRDHLVYEAVLSQLANKRQGTAATKTRAQIRGGGRKPWRQKGTGRARVGSTRSPLWRKGGTVFGPQPRDHSLKLPKKARQNALRSVLAGKHAENQILVLADIEFKEPRTREAKAFVEAFHLESALIIDSHENTNLFLAVRNLPKIKAVDARSLNIVDVLNHKWLVFSRKGFEAAMEILK
jgi:large subunit ribosomal protein L4